MWSMHSGIPDGYKMFSYSFRFENPELPSTVILYNVVIDENVSVSETTYPYSTGER